MRKSTGPKTEHCGTRNTSSQLETLLLASLSLHGAIL